MSTTGGALVVGLTMAGAGSGSACVVAMVGGAATGDAGAGVVSFMTVIVEWESRKALWVSERVVYLILLIGRGPPPERNTEQISNFLTKLSETSWELFGLWSAAV